MITFKIFSHVSLYVGIAFSALCLACGLYYLSEVSEEYTIFTKKFLRYTTFFIIFIHIVLFIFDGFPYWGILFGIFSHIIYHQLSHSFPFVELKNIFSLLSIVCFFGSHFVWFYYFTRFESRIYSFFEIIGFFFSNVWLVPGAYFVCLSVEDEMIIKHPELLRNTQKNILKKTPRNNIISWVMSVLKSIVGKKKDFYS